VPKEIEVRGRALEVAGGRALDSGQRDSCKPRTRRQALEEKKEAPPIRKGLRATNRQLFSMGRIGSSKMAT